SRPALVLSLPVLLCCHPAGICCFRCRCLSHTQPRKIGCPIHRKLHRDGWDVKPLPATSRFVVACSSLLSSRRDLLFPLPLSFSHPATKDRVPHPSQASPRWVGCKTSPSHLSFCRCLFFFVVIPQGSAVSVAVVFLTPSHERSGAPSIAYFAMGGM